MTQEEASEKICTDVGSLVDRFTLDHDISLRDTAQIYRELASECLDRANGLEHEADAYDREVDNDDGA